MNIFSLQFCKKEGRSKFLQEKAKKARMNTRRTEIEEVEKWLKNLILLLSVEAQVASPP